MTAPACQHRVNTPVHSPVRMHNHADHYGVNGDNVNIKSGGREEEEEEGGGEMTSKAATQESEKRAIGSPSVCRNGEGKMLSLISISHTEQLVGGVTSPPCHAEDHIEDFRLGVTFRGNF